MILARPGGPRRGFALALMGLVIGIIVVGIPWQWWRTAQRVPPIHDITTDTENPPTFVAILPLREEAPNPAEYGGPEIAVQQRTGYPDLGPLTLPVPPQQAFEHALVAARNSKHTLRGSRMASSSGVTSEPLPSASVVGTRRSRRRQAYGG